MTEREIRETENVRRDSKWPATADLKMEGAMNQGMWATSRSWEKLENEFSSKASTLPRDVRVLRETLTPCPLASQVWELGSSQQKKY